MGNSGKAWQLFLQFRAAPVIMTYVLAQHHPVPGMLFRQCQCYGIV